MDDWAQIVNELTGVTDPGTAYLLAMGAVDSPKVKELICLEIERQSLSIVPFSTELFIDSNQKKILVYIELGFFARFFRKNSIISKVYSRMLFLLRSYQCRVIIKKEYRDKARKIAKILAGQMDKQEKKKEIPNSKKEKEILNNKEDIANKSE